MKVDLSVFILVFLVFTALSTHAEELRPANHKFEDLFIWKVSDELKLSVPEEKSFSDLIRSLNQRKSSLNDQIQATLKKISAASPASSASTAGAANVASTASAEVAAKNAHKKSMDKTLSEYRSELKALNNLNIEEIDQVKKILGSERAAQYLVLKNDLANQLRSKLMNPDTDKSKADLPLPKIIEEQ